MLEDIDSVLEAKGNQKILSLNAISVYHWAIIYVLSFVITASLFFANNTTMAFIMGALFIPAIILVMFLLYDMDNCKWGEADTSIEPYLDVLRSMKVKEPGYLKKAHYAPTKRSTSKLFRFFYPTYE